RSRSESRIRSVTTTDLVNNHDSRLRRASVSVSAAFLLMGRRIGVCCPLLPVFSAREVLGVVAGLVPGPVERCESLEELFRVHGVWFFGLSELAVCSEVERFCFFVPSEREQGVGLEMADGVHIGNRER